MEKEFLELMDQFEAVSVPAIGPSMCPGVSPATRRGERSRNNAVAMRGMVTTCTRKCPSVTTAISPMAAMLLVSGRLWKPTRRTLICLYIGPDA